MDSSKIWHIYSSLFEPPNVGCNPLLVDVWSLTENRLITIFLYMVAELSALQQIVNALTGLNGLPVVIVE